MNHSNLLDKDYKVRRLEELQDTIGAMISQPQFPCVGAKSALARDNLKTVVAHRLDSNWDDLAIHRELLAWAREYRECDEGFRSLAVIFEGPEDLSEVEFERLMWERIQSVADKDAWLGQSYDERVSADPEDPHFSLSFGGEAFFVIFNLHDQFERLREEGRYEKMRDTILDRDRKLAGDINPMLAKHGESSEARQYSGRKVGDDWQCPFQDRRTP